MTLRRAEGPWKFWAISAPFNDLVIPNSDMDNALDWLLNHQNELTDTDILNFVPVQAGDRMGTHEYAATISRSTSNASLNMFNLGPLIRAFPWRSPTEYVEDTAIGTGGRFGHRGKPGFEAACTALMSYQANATYDLLVKEQGKHRLLYVERNATGKKLWAVVQLYDVGENVAALQEDTPFDFTIRSAKSAPVVWQ